MSEGREDTVKDISFEDKERFFVEQSKFFAVKMQGLRVEEKKNIIRWRKIFSIFMLFFLSTQYVVIIAFLGFQGFEWFPFELDEYIFYILIAGTLVQSYFLVQIIFKYMFSENR